MSFLVLSRCGWTSYARVKLPFLHKLGSQHFSFRMNAKQLQAIVG